MSTLKRALTLSVVSVAAVILPAAAQAASLSGRGHGLIAYIWSWGG